MIKFSGLNNAPEIIARPVVLNFGSRDSAGNKVLGGNKYNLISTTEQLKQELIYLDLLHKWGLPAYYSLANSFAFVFVNKLSMRSSKDLDFKD